MSESFNRPILKNPEGQFNQSMLPSTIRRAVGIAMLAGASTGCTMSKQPDIQPVTPIVHIPETIIPSDTTDNETTKSPNEIPKERSFFTPKKALQAALSKPLRLAGELDGDALGYPLPVYLWENGKILLTTYNDSPGPYSTEQQLEMAIHSASGETIEIIVRAPSSQSIYDTDRSKYIDFGVRYKNYSAANPGFNPNLGPREFETLMRTLRQPGDVNPLTYCNVFYSREMKCFCSIDDMIADNECKDVKRYKNLKKSSGDFWKEPTHEWYELMQELKKLHQRYGFR